MTSSRAETVRPGSSRLDRVGEVFDLVRRGTCTTVTELAARTGMARSTVAQRVDRLVEHGLLRVSDDGHSGRGRPPNVLEFDPGSGAVLAAQLGITGARLAVTDLAGNILADTMMSVAIGLGPDTVLEHLYAAFDRVLGAANLDRGHVRGVGVGLPSAIELATAGGGNDRHVGAREWEHFPLADSIAATFGAPVVIDNDLNLLALGEQRSCCPDADVFLCLKVGTVIGCGVVVNGQPVRGAQALSGGIGHTRVPGNDTPCLCGNIGCLDAVAGGGALAARLASQGLPTKHAQDVARLAREGVVPAVQAVRNAGRDIGEVLAAAVNLLNPIAIAVWGYLVEAEEPLFAGIRETLYKRSLPAASRSLQLLPAQLGDNAGPLGAAAMVIEQILSAQAIEQQLAGSPGGTPPAHRRIG